MSNISNHVFLVGGLEHVLFFHLLGLIIPIDKKRSEGLKPPTSFVFGTYMVMIFVVGCVSWFEPLESRGQAGSL